ncbi:hypothetical protein [Streptomyces sparsogenes]|uniref:hypothetical protein n=1 Tax=Streptomyces sparsogenes TaxID=67365 RepID=UPI001301CE7E|nr:hypothetical protein [Streptomyces sparsogenes]
MGNAKKAEKAPVSALETTVLRDALVVPVRMSLGWPAARSSSELVDAVRGAQR